MIQKVEIEGIYTKVFNEGSKKEFTALNIKTTLEGRGQTWLNGYEQKENRDWQEGDVVLVNIYEKDKTDKNGDPYLGYKIPDASDLVGLKVDTLIQRQKQIYKMVKVIYKAVIEQQGANVQQPQPKNIRQTLEDADAGMNDTSLPPKEQRQPKQPQPDGSRGQRDDVPNQRPPQQQTPSDNWEDDLYNDPDLPF